MGQNTSTHFAVCLRFLSGQTDSPRPITLLRRNKVVVLLRFTALRYRICKTYAFGPVAPVECNVAFRRSAVLRSAQGLRIAADTRRIAILRKSGASWATVCQETGLSKGTAQRAIHRLPKNDLRVSCAIGSGEPGSDSLFY